MASVVDAVSNKEDALTRKTVKREEPAPSDCECFFVIDIDRSPDDPLFYGVKEMSGWLRNPAIQGRVVTLVRIAREIVLEDLKFQTSDFTADHYSTNLSLGSFRLRICAEKSVLRRCFVEIVLPSFSNVVHVFIHYDSLDKVVINNHIEDFELAHEKSWETEKRHTFPRSQAVAILYLAVHKPVAHVTKVWYKFALEHLREAMVRKKPNYVDLILKIADDDSDAALELRDMRHSKSEVPVVNVATDEYEHYDEALRLAHGVMSEPRIRPLLLGVAYGSTTIMLDFGFVYVNIRPTLESHRKFGVSMGKYSKCGGLLTGDVQRVQEALLDTTKLTMREMRLKYDDYYRRSCAKANTQSR